MVCFAALLTNSASRDDFGWSAVEVDLELNPELSPRAYADHRCRPEKKGANLEPLCQSGLQDAQYLPILPPLMPPWAS